MHRMTVLAWRNKRTIRRVSQVGLPAIPVAASTGTKPGTVFVTPGPGPSPYISILTRKISSESIQHLKFFRLQMKLLKRFREEMR